MKNQKSGSLIIGGELCIGGKIKIKMRYKSIGLQIVTLTRPQAIALLASDNEDNYPTNEGW